MAARREHSEKPDAVYAIIERMYPELPRIELFARNRRKGWDAWGNEAPFVIEPERLPTTRSEQGYSPSSFDLDLNI